ncbi:uncharacterized protein LOC122864256 [Siniperca chuatsi]|uniref:uncharacterized protein LOC122864256 n=1 Tax=Siniperca chuatsi TaxID=119488 RepID=UPI001CE0E242|nr:uncharacterized protein LOC122864256 [Siniperca chuatsi]
MTAMQGAGLTIGSTLGFSVLPKDTLSYEQQELGIDPPTLISEQPALPPEPQPSHDFNNAKQHVQLGDTASNEGTDVPTASAAGSLTTSCMSLWLSVQPQTFQSFIRRRLLLQRRVSVRTSSCGASTPGGDPNVMEAKWQSMVNHVQDIMNTPLLYFPAHPHLGEMQGKRSGWNQVVVVYCMWLSVRISGPAFNVLGLFWFQCTPTIK